VTFLQFQQLTGGVCSGAVAGPCHRLPPVCLGGQRHCVTPVVGPKLVSMGRSTVLHSVRDELCLVLLLKARFLNKMNQASLLEQPLVFSF